MVKKSRLLLIVAIIVFALPSCKKGDDDPFLSLRSRKARFIGEWKLKAGSITSINNDSSVTTTFNGTTASSIYGTYPYTETWSIKKDGSFVLQNNNNGFKNTTKGFWSFGNKIKGLDLKNKEYVIFKVTTKTHDSYGLIRTETYTGTSCPIYTYNILELKNKVMTIVFEGSDTLLTNSETNSGTITYNQ